MITIQGTYNSATAFTPTMEPIAESQIRAMLDQPFCAGSKIRIMPDVHAGKGCTIGTTMTITDKVVPNIVGVDIGCGMETIKLKNKRINLPELDSFIKKNIPSGRNVRERPHRSHGRLMSRKEAKNQVTLSAFKKSMEGIFTTTLSKDTLDEAPMVYKPMEEIIGVIGDTVRIDKIIKPIYNFNPLEQQLVLWIKK